MKRLDQDCKSETHTKTLYNMCASLCICSCVYMYVFIYIYIYIHRERERERCVLVCASIDLSIEVWRTCRAIDVLSKAARLLRAMGRECRG